MLHQRILRSSKTRVNRWIVDGGNSLVDRYAQFLDNPDGKREPTRGTYAEPKSSRLKVLWVGANRSQDYSGFRQSLGRFAKVTEFHNSVGGYGLRNPFRDDLPATRVAAENATTLWSIYQAQKPFDLVLGQMWRHRIEPWVLESIQADETPVVNIAMDERLPLQWLPYPRSLSGAAALARSVTLTLTTSPSAALVHNHRGARAEWWPLASDPATFHNRDYAERDIACSFIGNRYGQRARLIEHLAELGHQVECFGRGWANGEIDAEQMVDVLSRSRLSIGSGYVGHSKRTLTLKLRDFDVPMSGALYATTSSDELKSLYPPNTIYLYKSTEQLAETMRTVSQLSAQEWTLRSMATREACESRHSWDQRISELLAHVWPDVAHLPEQAVDT